MCRRCKLAHSRIPRTNNDEVIFLSEARQQRKSKSEVTLCIDHPTEEISFFCERCNQFICGECIDDKHQEHKIMTLKKIKSKKDKLVEFMEDLKAKKKNFAKALDTENNVYTQNTKCYDQIRTDISDQVNKIIRAVTSLRDERFTELSTLQEKENQRHSDTLTSIQSNTQVLASALLLIQTGIDSGNPITMETAENNARQSVQNVEVPPAPIKAATKYKPGEINRPVMLPLFGDMLTEDQGARAKYPGNLSNPQSLDVAQHKIVLNKVKTKNIVQARNTGHTITVIVPITQNTAWVASARDKRLTMINSDGCTVRTSVQLCQNDSYVIDAKQYNNDILVSCYKQHIVIMLSEDGTTKTTYSDVSPFYPLGLYVAHAMDVVVCLKSSYSVNDKDAKVVRLNSNGDIVHSIKHDGEGNVMYTWPFSVTSIQSEEIIVCDRGHHNRVSCVKNECHLMFTWSGEVQGRKIDKFDSMCITHDKYNNLLITDSTNHRVCALNKDGTEAKCLIDRTQGVQYPYAIAVDDGGQLWVGCAGGNIHVLEY